MPSTGTISPTPGTEPSSARAESPAWFGLNGVSFAYDGRPAVRDVSFEFSGQFLTLLGPSGCGKTTLLKLIGGSLTPSAGRVVVGGVDVTALPPEKREIGMVFQNYALFPYLSARRNVSFGLEVRGLPHSTCLDRANDMLRRVGLTAAEADRKPGRLPGGQQQRVALARALVFGPRLLLLDEPLANLDRHLRDTLRAELRRLQRETGVTTVMVTHDAEEALAASDQVGVMADGRLLQFGTPDDVYRRPNSVSVARSLGEVNLVSGEDIGAGPGGTYLVRPEWCQLGDAARGPRVWHARVEAVEFLGPDVVVDARCIGGPRLRVRTRTAPGLRPGELTRVSIPADAAWAIPDACDGPPT